MSRKIDGMGVLDKALFLGKGFVEPVKDIFFGFMPDDPTQVITAVENEKPAAGTKENVWQAGVCENATGIEEGCTDHRDCDPALRGMLSGLFPPGS
jgi:hypothetical protein